MAVTHMSDPNAEFWNWKGAAYTASDGLRRASQVEFAAVLYRDSRVTCSASAVSIRPVPLV